ncbi:hypothetical protein HG530_006654 [Fusarium avenaceum]|nr:hypothetical protein HG530_006654 [Fusarium avenaceum]
MSVVKIQVMHLLLQPMVINLLPLSRDINLLLIMASIYIKGLLLIRIIPLRDSLLLLRHIRQAVNLLMSIFPAQAKAACGDNGPSSALTLCNSEVVLLIGRAVLAILSVELNNTGTILSNGDANEGSVSLSLSRSKAVAVLVLDLAGLRVAAELGLALELAD